MWRDLAPVGRSSASGGYFRQPFTTVESRAAAWFLEQCARPRSRGRAGREREPPGGTVRVAGGTAERVPNVADDPSSSAPTSTRSSTAGRTTARWAWSPRSRRSTCCGSEASPRAGRSSSGAFAEEEGSRFGLACLGLAARDRDHLPGRRRRSCGTATAYPFSTRWPPPGWSRSSAGPRGWTASAASSSCTSSRGATSSTGTRRWGWRPAIWPHGRYRFDFTGEANHAGTTRMEDRHDPMLSYAMTALAAGKEARLTDQRATFGRLDVAPNGTNAIPSRVTGVARRPLRQRRVARRARRRDRAPGHRARRPRRDAGSGDARVGVRSGLLRPRPHRATAAGLADARARPR